MTCTCVPLFQLHGCQGTYHHQSCPLFVPPSKDDLLVLAREIESQWERLR